MKFNIGKGKENKKGRAFLCCYDLIQIRYCFRTENILSKVLCSPSPVGK